MHLANEEEVIGHFGGDYELSGIGPLTAVDENESINNRLKFYTIFDWLPVGARCTTDCIHSSFQIRFLDVSINKC